MDDAAVSDRRARWRTAAPQIAEALRAAGWKARYETYPDGDDQAEVLAFPEGKPPDGVLLAAGELCGARDLIEGFLGVEVAP